MTTTERLAQAWIAAVRELDAGTLSVERYQTRCETILALAEAEGTASGFHAGAFWALVRAGV